MATDWAARLDARGYHATPVRRGDTAARWDGPTRVSPDDGLTEGDAIVAYDPTEESTMLRLRVGDAVYLSGARKGAPAEIAIIESFVASKQGDIFLFANWLWRPERMRLADDVDWDARELFLQVGRDPDENSVCTIELTAVKVSELSKPADLTDAPHTFFWRRTYDVTSHEISKLPEEPTAMEEDEPTPSAPPPAAAARASAGAGRRNDTKQRAVEVYSSLIGPNSAPS